MAAQHVLSYRLIQETWCLYSILFFIVGFGIYIFFLDFLVPYHLLTWYVFRGGSSISQSVTHSATMVLFAYIYLIHVQRSYKCLYNNLLFHFFFISLSFFNDILLFSCRFLSCLFSLSITQFSLYLLLSFL